MAILALIAMLGIYLVHDELAKGFGWSELAGLVGIIIIAVVIRWLLS
jgi:hypothetical protein